jgi:phosphoenolpyruvate synthase/pyruvate phosphate dikinase
MDGIRSFQELSAEQQAHAGGKGRVLSEARSLDQAHEMAVVVQRLFRADVSGVLFTAGPVTGSYARMVGNLVHGLGKQLVSGETSGQAFALARPRGKYSGPPELKRFARRLYRLASRLEEALGDPQDIEWAVDPNRRSDYFDSHAPMVGAGSETLTGFAGAAGRVEGLVRRLDSAEEGDQLQPGEILVTTTTNVGWTPLFPRVAAIVTDVGAPLSYAAIVARELGIPAVVGCGNATTQLHIGDRVLVDGARGTVEILEEL